MSTSEASGPPTRLRRLVESTFWVAVPAAAVVVGRVIAASDVDATWRALLAGMVLAVAAGAFGAQTFSSAALRLPGLALLAGAVHLLFGAGPERSGAVALLYLGVAAAAAGLAAAGRRARAPEVPAGAVAALVLWTAMAGLYWADPVAEHLPRTERRAFRQAALHVDPSLALAYDAADFDRLRAPDVYASVPLASSLFERPEAPATAAIWLALGIVAGAGGKWGRRRSTAG